MSTNTKKQAKDRCDVLMALSLLGSATPGYIAQDLEIHVNTVRAALKWLDEINCARGSQGEWWVTGWGSELVELIEAS